MSASLIWACLLVAYGPPAILFLILVARKSQLLITFILSALVWLIAFLFSSILWSIFAKGIGFEKDWFTVILLVACEESIRCVFINFYSRFENTFSVVSTNAVAFPIVDFYIGVAGGLGFGLANSIMIYGYVLSSADGVGIYFADTCSAFNAFILSAFLGLFFCLLHVVWMILSLDAFRRRSPIKFAGVVILHLFTAILTTLNMNNDGCLYAIPLIFVTLLGTGVWTYYVVTRPTYHSKQRFD